MRKPVEEQEADQVGHLAFLAASYKPEFWYMEVFECFRRLYSSAALVFVTPGSATQAVVASNPATKTKLILPLRVHLLTEQSLDFVFTLTNLCFVMHNQVLKHYYRTLRLLLAQFTIFVYATFRQFKNVRANVLAQVGDRDRNFVDDTISNFEPESTRACSFE